MRRDVVIELSSNNSLKNFRDEIKIRDRAVVLELVSIKFRFFKEGSNDSTLKCIREDAMRKTAVNDRGNGGDQKVDTIFDQECGPRIKTAGFGGRRSEDLTKFLR